MKALRKGRKFLKRAFEGRTGGQVVEAGSAEGTESRDDARDIGDIQALSAQAPYLPQDQRTENGVSAFHSAHQVQLQNSNVNMVGRDVVHNVNVVTTHNHYHELKDELKAILDAVANYRNIQQDTLAKATPGTIEWFFEWKEFKIFIDVNGDLRILWGSGMPGAGKTIFASIVIDWLERLARESDGQVCVAYAYIRYSDQDQVTVRGILETLVKQTLERHPDCAAIVKEAFAVHVQEKTRPTEDELLSFLRQFSESKRATFYVLDALDEAPDRIRRVLLQRLSSLGVRLFITSRPLESLEKRFPQAYPFTISAQDHDLELHVNEKISQSEHLQDLLDDSDPEFRQHLVSMVKEKSGGMFLHATLQLDALQGCFTKHAAIQTLESFPQRIEDVYKQTWERIVHSDDHQASLTKAAFAWVIHAQQSLTVDQLRHALAACPETFHIEEARLMSDATIVSACRGLVVIDKESKLVRLVHYTAKSTLKALLINSFPQPHSLLAAVCVAFLADRGFQNTTLTKSEELDKALEEPFLDYAYSAWPFHTRESLQSDLTASLRVVGVFISGCSAFPVFTPDEHHFWAFDIIQPMHVIARFGLPLAFAGPCEANTINALSTKQNWTPLMYASRFGHEGTVKALLAHPDIQVNLDGGKGETALILASESGREGTVKLLLTHPDIQVNLAESDGWTPLMYACVYGYKEVVELLLTHPDSQVNQANEDGWRALHIASYNRHARIVRLLLAVPDIDVNTVTTDNETAIKRAAEEGFEDIVQMLLQVPGIEITVRSSRDGHTAMSTAGEECHLGIVRLLEEFEATQASKDANCNESGN